MKTIEYDNRLFMQVTERSWVRHRGNDRLEVLTLDNDELTFKTRTVLPSLFKSVKSLVEDAELQIEGQLFFEEMWKDDQGEGGDEISSYPAW